jgi:hypothetical protein
MIGFARFFMPLIFIFALIFNLIGRTQNGQCKSNNILYKWDCNPLASENSLPQETLITLLSLPVVQIIYVFSNNWEVTFSIWLISTVSIFSLVLYYQLYESLLSLTIYSVFSTLCVIEVLKQSYRLCLFNDKFEQSVMENKRLTDDKENDMKNMIGNVAHDLKTVSFKHMLFCYFLLFI